MLSIGRTFDDFIQDRETSCSIKTIIKYREDVALFFRFLKICKLDPYHDGFDKLPEDSYKGFVVWLRSKRKRAVSIRSYCRSVKVFLRWCNVNGLCPDLTSGVKLPRDDSKVKLPLYSSEVKKIVDCFEHNRQGDRDSCIFHLMLDCGLRRQEVVNLDVENLELDKNVIIIMDSKGNKSRMVLIPDFLICELRYYLGSRINYPGKVFLSLRGSEPISNNTIKMIMQRLKVKSGVDRLHAHLLRHTFATSYLIGGGNLEFLRVFLGHSDYDVTKIYSSMAAQMKMLRADIYKLDPIFFERGY